LAQITNLKSGANYQNTILDVAQITYFFLVVFGAKLHTPPGPIDFGAPSLSQKYIFFTVKNNCSYS